MKQRLVKALEKGKKTKQELCHELKVTDRYLRQLRSEINADRTKDYEKVFIKAHRDGGYSLGTIEDIEEELNVIGSRLKQYYRIIGKLSAISGVTKQEHIF